MPESVCDPKLLPESTDPLGPKILLIEDLGPKRNALVGGLSAAGFNTTTANDELDAIEQFRVSQPDLVLLDLSVHHSSGLSACQKLREVSSVPILLLASADASAEVLFGLEMGASDFVTRPFDLGALVRHISELVRQDPPAETSTETITVGPLTIRPGRRAVAVRGDEVHFARLEYDLLLALVVRPGQIRTQDELLYQIWGGRARDAKTLNVHIRRLRKKIEIDQANPKIIINARGIGYYLDPEAS
jgi:DNA-binding response OmpR family regulator